MTTLFSEGFSKLVKFIFDFYDFDKDGKISKEDVRVVLSYIPLNTNKYSQMKLKYEQEEFKDRVESQDELHDLLEKSFANTESLDHSAFQKIVENVSSDIFLYILIFLLDKRPFSKQTLEQFKGVKKSAGLLGAPSTTASFNKTPQVTSKILIASPNLNSKFTPSVTISKSPSMTKRNTMSLGVMPGASESKNMLLRLAGKGDTTSSNQSVLLKYAGGGAKAKTENEENTDEGVSINNVKNIPIQRKQRHNLRDIESIKEPLKKNTDYDNLPITPAVKLGKNKLGEEE